MKGAVPPLSSLEPWIAARLGKARLRPGDLAAWQLDQLRRTVATAHDRSPFFTERLKGRPLPGSLDDLSGLPFTTEEDLRHAGMDMLCVSQDQVARAVTMASSGTTGRAKRLFFSEADVEATIDFFHHGMSGIVGPGESVLILLPGGSPDSTGDLLRRGLVRFDASGEAHGLAPDPRPALNRAMALKADCLVGFPVQVLAMARLAKAEGLAWAPESVLLCSDYVPVVLRRELGAIWGCRVFSHWGTVETGLGGAVECAALAGAHVREADLLVEVVAPDTGLPLPPGKWGELVATTLTREAMPLVRYRTGDLGRVLPGACACGSALKRLDTVRGRLAKRVRTGPGMLLALADMDEALFDLPEVMDFQARLQGSPGRSTLLVRLAVLEGHESRAVARARNRLLGLATVRDLNLAVTAEPWTAVGISPGKRILEDERTPWATC